MSTWSTGAAERSTRAIEPKSTTYPQIRAGVTYPGVEPQVLEEVVAKPLEAALAVTQEASPPTTFKFDPSPIPVYEAAFSSETRDLISLRDWVEQRLRPQLLTVEGIASVDVFGGLLREVQVVLDQERLRSYGLTLSQVNEALRSANQDVAAGQAMGGRCPVCGQPALSPGTAAGPAFP